MSPQRPNPFLHPVPPAMGTVDSVIVRPPVDRDPEIANGSGVAVTRYPLGGPGAVELRRGSRLDLFGDLDTEPVFVPPPPGLDAADSAAAERLAASAKLQAPAAVEPFRPFSATWEITGTQSDRLRVLGYRLVDGSSGRVIDLVDEATLADLAQGQSRGSAFVSMWKSAPLRLQAVFRSGVAELTRRDVAVDISGCSPLTLPVVALLSNLQSAGAEQFRAAAEQEAIEEDRRQGGDGNISIAEEVTAVATHGPMGFRFEVVWRVQSSEGSARARLAITFDLYVRQAALAALVDHRTIDVEITEVDPSGVLSSVLAWIFGTPGQVGLQSSLAWGLQRFAQEVARGVQTTLLGSDDRRKPVAVTVDDSTVAVTVCPAGRLVPSGGLIGESELHET